MILGTTYSHRHIDYLGLDNSTAFEQLLNMKFDIVRLCCYWSELEEKKNTYNFSRVKILLDQCEETNQSVILTLGVKAPRWPEFYVPTWVREGENYTLYLEKLLIKIIEEFKNYSCVKYWQVENEPLDPVWPTQQRISLELLEKEIDIIRQHDKIRPIVTTAWGNNLSERKLLEKLQQLSDIVGIDLYYRQAIGKTPFGTIYSGPKDSDKYLSTMVSNSKKPIWITELQAEAWEFNEIVSKSKNPGSINPQLLKSNFKRACSLNPQCILFWGFEYWLLQEKRQNSGLLNTVKAILTDRSL